MARGDNEAARFLGRMMPKRRMMSKLAKRSLFTVLLAALLTLAAWYFSRPRPVDVLVDTVQRGRIEATVVNTRAGTVKACRRALLAPAIGGQIDQLLVREGMEVKAGARLLSLWSKDLQAEVDLSRSELRAAAAAAKTACLAAEIAEREASRFRILQKTGMVAEEETDRRITTAKMKQAECQSLQAREAVSQSRLKAAEAHLQRTVLAAPFAGVVAEVNGEVGEYITPSPLGIQTLPAVDLVDRSCFYVSAPIDEVDASAIRPGMPARITMDAFAGRLFSGKVKRIADYVLDREKQARTVDIEVEFDNQQDLQDLLPGYSADAEVVLEVRNDILRIPTEALSTEGTAFVFHQESGLLEKRTVSKGISNWEFTEVTTGLAEGERIVLTIDRKGVEDGAWAVSKSENGH